MFYIIHQHFIFIFPIVFSSRGYAVPLPAGVRGLQGVSGATGQGYSNPAEAT